MHISAQINQNFAELDVASVSSVVERWERIFSGLCIDPFLYDLNLAHFGFGVSERKSIIQQSNLTVWQMQYKRGIEIRFHEYRMPGDKCNTSARFREILRVSHAPWLHTGAVACLPVRHG
jgi:hypothetical protein